MFFRSLVIVTLLNSFIIVFKLHGEQTHNGSPPSTRNLSHEDCLRQLTTAEEGRLIGELGRIQTSFFSGATSAEERERAIANVFRALNPTGDATREIALRARTLQFTDTAAKGPVLEIIARLIKGEQPTQRELTMIRGLGAEDPQGYLNEVRDNYGGYFRALFDIGVKFNARTGFDFKEARLSRTQLQNNATLQTALRLFVSPEITDRLLQQNRTVPIFMGDTVFSPPETGGTIPVLSREDYEQRVQRRVRILSSETESFIRSSRAANSYWEMMQGRWRGRGDGLGVAETARNGSYNTMMQMIRDLRSLGMTPELQREVNQIHTQAIQIEANHIQDGYRTINMATTAMIAAPLIPLIIAAAPFAGAAAGISAATMTQASATMALIPMVFSMGRSAIHAGVNYARNGGSLWCHLASNAIEGGTQALRGAAIGAALPLIPAAAASAATVLGATTATVLTTHGAVNLTVALGFFANGANNVRRELLECHNTLQRAQTLSNQGQTEAASTLTTQAIRTCMDAGIDLAFSIVSARQLARQGAQLRQQIRQNRLTHNEELAQTLIGRERALTHREAIEQAHRVGEGQMGRDGRTPARIGNYTDQQLQDKYNILARAGLTREEIQLLMDRGVVGRSNVTRAYNDGEELEPGGRTTQGTRNNRSGGQSAGQQLQSVETQLGLSSEQRRIFGIRIHQIKEDPNCPLSWRIDRNPNNDLTYDALIRIGRAVRDRPSNVILYDE